MKGIFLPLKQTQPVDLIKTFETHIAKKYGKEAVPNVHATLEGMQKLRNGLDFAKMQAQLNNDHRLAADFQLQIINYVRYVYLIDNFFKNDFAESRYLKLNFTWTDSFQPKKGKSINHIKYELSSCLYNLAMCYYLEGIHLIASPGAQDKLKGTTKLRAALWCITEIKQIMPSLLVNPNDIPSDLNLSYINLLANYFVGLTYSALVEVMGADPKKHGGEKLASVNKAASKHFQIAHDIINSMKPSPLPDQQAKALKINLLFNATMFRSDAYFQISQIHLAKVDDEILKGHMGLATSYLRITKNDFDQILQRKGELDLLSFDQRAALMERSKIIYNNYENCNLKNSRVYKQQEFTADQLPEIPEDKSTITPIEPKDIKKKLDDERNFEGFLSPEIVAIKAEFMNLVSMKMLEVENSLKNANNVKNKIYSESYVNYLLDLESQAGDKKFDIPPQLKARIEKFKKNGGFNAYTYTHKNIVETSGNCVRMLEEIKALLAREKDEDENLRKQYPSQWNRAYSEQVNQEYVFKLRDLEQKFFIAQNTDKDVFKKYDQYQDWMQKFSLADEQILQLIPRSSDSEFVGNNKSKLVELSSYNAKIIDLMDLEKQRNYIITLAEEFMKTDFIPSFAAINAKQADKQTEFDKMLTPYQTKLTQVESKINEAYPLLDTIATLAKGINSTRSESNQSAVKVLEEMSLAITVINDIYNDFQQGLHFYTNLTFHLNALQKVVNDFCLARDIEKNALLQELQAQNQYSNNFNNPKPFFQENSMQFPKGTSVFVTANQHLPQNQQGGGGNYGQQHTQQPQGYVNTQMYNPNQNPSQNYNPQNQGQTHTQMYNPGQNQGNYAQTQMYNPGQQQYNPGNQQYTNPSQNQNQGLYGNNQVTSQMGYMPLSKPDNEGTGQFGQFGNVVESTFIGGNMLPNQNQGNPYYNQGKGPGQY